LELYGKRYTTQSRYDIKDTFWIYTYVESDSISFVFLVKQGLQKRNAGGGKVYTQTERYEPEI